MTKTNVFKKSVSLALAFTMLLSLFCIMSKTNVGAVTDRVSMYSSDFRRFKNLQSFYNQL